MYYLFPFHLIDKGSNIVLYGAGNAGKNFAKQVALTNYCNIVGIVDKNYENAQVRDIPVYPVDWLKEKEYDKVFITIVNEKVHKQILQDLLTMGIPDSKIVSYISPTMDWDNPNRGFLNQKEEYILCKKLGDYLKEINPAILISSDRIDVIVRYLLFKDLMSNIENKEHLSLFSRFTMARTGGHESPSYFSGGGKTPFRNFWIKDINYVKV